jgi:glycosyltransferase involved in cell wall biosynthesis
VVPRKGLLPLLSSLSGLDRDLWRLTIVGGYDFDSAYTARVRTLIQNNDMTGSIDFLGPRNDEDLVEILKENQIFCMPFAYEGFGIAILEAMGFGLPAIGSSEGAARETISHGKNGYLLDPDDLSGLGPLLGGLHQERKRLEKMAHAARATFLSRPRWQDSVTTIETFLSKLLERRRPDTPAVPVGERSWFRKT